jgi:hypothetical protein
MNAKTKEIEIPDVSGLSVAKAEKKLESLGFEVKDEVTEKNSDTIEEGNVIEPTPLIREIYWGRILTLEESQYCIEEEWSKLRAFGLV